ncbi:MAG TPA: alpha/beta hydrolase [Candidatus Dormibacteraeota bacterium]|jgi:hypothetical protein|nr:alpha/beta hydrolase [Candidatus Dormibacteraeota bacterium]
MKIANSMKSAKVLICILFVFSTAVMSQESSPQKQSQPPKAESLQAGVAVTGSSLEDWTDLSLRSSSLRMKRPVLAESDDVPGTGFIRERYEVTWRSKDPFDLYVIRPRGVTRAPVILYLYSFPEDTDQFKNNSWCEDAVSGGYAAIGFVGAVTGHRTRYRLPKEWFVSEMQESLGSTVHDVQLILDYVATRKDLDAGRVAMFGSGSGGAVAILTSAVDPRIKVVDLMGPWADWPTWVAETKILRDDERATFAKPEFLAKVAPLEPVSWLPKSKAKALRIQDVRGNKSMPDKAQENLEAAAPDFAVVNQYGNGRAFLANTQPARLFEWMKDELKPDAKLHAATDKASRVHFYPAVQAPQAPAWPSVGTLEVEKTNNTANAKPEKDKAKPNQN